MSAIEILYLILLVGSLAFGLEALFLGLGGKLMVLYRRRKVKTIMIALAVGLAIVGPAIVTSMALTLEPLYFCVVVLAYSFVASKIIGAFRMKLVRTPTPPLPPQPSEREIKAMLQKRGLGRLVSKKRAKSGG
ncbi:MAG: hypothetical protein AVW05_02845 [Hadesarchaea archaeon DG-33]|nr:MAG: hypothetical protein AVW05_02845 [Hadesarchaea archaeon DG-33]